MKESEKPRVSALNIGGVPWKIPRIDPEKHFSVMEFSQAIQNATYASSSPKVVGNTQGSTTHTCALQSEELLMKVDFIWLDVACIDQSSALNAAEEIGRQATIFKGAQSVYIWLCTARRGQLNYLFQQLGSLADKLEFAIFRMMNNWQVTVTSLLEDLAKDPWFSSLWTLQEAHLCPRAVFLSRDAQCIQWRGTSVMTLLDLQLGCESRGHKLFTATLMDLLLVGETVQKAAEKSLALRNQPRDHRIINLLQRTGLSALASGNPMTLYSISSTRQVTYELDRIYGIMQVFGFRLGLSADNADPQHEFSLSELEDEFGVALLDKFPVLSQLYVFTDRPSLGKGWHLSCTSAIPRFVKEIPCFKWKNMSQPTPLFETSTKYVGDVLWGYIRGKACKFSKLQCAWAEVDRPPFKKALENATPQDISLDALPSAPHKSPEHGVMNIPRTPRQHRLASWLTDTFGDDLSVILLANCSPDDRNNFAAESCNIGLIILKQNNDGMQYWQRIGICVWYLHQLEIGETEASEMAFLTGNDDNWQCLEGLLG